MIYNAKLARDTVSLYGETIPAGTELHVVDGEHRDSKKLGEKCDVFMADHAVYIGRYPFRDNATMFDDLEQWS